MGRGKCLSSFFIGGESRSDDAVTIRDDARSKLVKHCGLPYEIGRLNLSSRLGTTQKPVSSPATTNKGISRWELLAH